MIITFAVIIILLGAKISSALLVFCLIGMVVGEILLVILQCLQKTFENLNRIVATLSFILNSFSEIALRALCICAGIKIYGKYLISTDNGKQYTPIVSSEEEQYLNGWIINVLVLAITYGVQRTFIRWMLWIWTAEKFRSRVEQTKPKRRVLRALADVAADYEAHIDLQIKFEHELAAGTAIARALGKLTKEKNQQEEGKYDNNDEGNKIITSSPSRVGQCTSFLRRYAIERGIAPPPPIGTPLDLRSSSANNLRQRKCSPGKEQISNNSANRPAFLLQQTSCTLLGRNSIVQERSALEQDDDEQQRRDDIMKAKIQAEANHGNKSLHQTRFLFRTVTPQVMGSVGRFQYAIRHLDFAVDLGHAFGPLKSSNQSRRAAKRIFRLLHAMSRESSDLNNLSPAHSESNLAMVEAAAHARKQKRILHRQKRATIERNDLLSMIFTSNDIKLAQEARKLETKAKLWGKPSTTTNEQDHSALFGQLLVSAKTKARQQRDHSRKQMQENLNAFDTLFPPTMAWVQESDFVEAVQTALHERRFLSATIDARNGINELMERVATATWLITFGLFFTLAFWDIAIIDWLLALASLLIAFSVAFSSTAANFVLGCSYILFTAPYDIGDRLLLAQPSQQTWMILPLTVFKIGAVTTQFKSVYGETLTLANAELSRLAIINHSRSPNPFMQINLHLSTATPAKLIKQFVGGIRYYVNTHAEEWVAANIFFVDLKTQNNALVLDCWFGSTSHYHNWNCLFQSRSKLISFIHCYAQNLGIVFIQPIVPISSAQSIHLGDTSQNDPTTPLSSSTLATVSAACNGVTENDNHLV